MTQIVFESLISLIDSILCIYFILKFNNSSWKKSKFAIPAILLHFLITLVSDYFVPQFSLALSVVLLILAILYAISVCKKHYVRAIITACVYKMEFILLSSVIVTVLSQYMDFNELMYGSNSIGRYIFAVIHKVALFALSNLLAHVFNKNSRLEMKTGIYTLGISLLTILGLGTTMYITITPGGDPFSGNILIITVAFVLINILVYFLIWQVQKLQENKYELKLIQAKMKFDETRHNDISALWNETRKVQHDIKQHLAVIANQLEDGSIDECQKYVSDLLPTIERMGKLVKSDNAVLDYIINTKLGSLDDTHVHISNTIADLSDIRDADLACLMGNMLDNAIEATRALDDKRIELLFAMQNSNRIIICKNTIAESVLKTNKELASTKPNRDRHGLGHLIMEKVAKDYNGFVDYFEEDGMFGVEIILPLPEEAYNSTPIGACN